MGDKLATMETPPILLDQLDLETIEDRNMLESLTMTRYDTVDVMEADAKCGCGHLGYDNVGAICLKCNTMVTTHHDQDMKPNLWVSVPEVIGSTLSPLVWYLLSRPLTGKKYNVLRWCLDSSFPAPDPTNKTATAIVNRFIACDYQRGMRYVEQEMDKLLDVAYKSCGSRQAAEELGYFMEVYKDNLFTSHIPIPSKVYFAIENTAYGTYYDKTIGAAMEAIYSAVGLHSEKNTKKLEKRFTSILNNLLKYYEEIVANTLSKKKGWLRRVNFGTRMNFSHRDIVTSEHGLHISDEIRIPYSQMVVMLEPLLRVALVREHGFNYSEAKAYIMTHTTDDDPLLWGILEGFIDDTPVVPKSLASVYVLRGPCGTPELKHLDSTLKTRERIGGGIRDALTRYPSLTRMSTGGFRIVGMTSSEIRLSVLSLVANNCD